ncbi:MAG: hypothetical protein NT099_02680 [Candidatus Saganbacteria bacterium]|nr:hypothetical protein [Candidatus Saganbacteria bacterium]
MFIPTNNVVPKQFFDATGRLKYGVLRTLYHTKVHANDDKAPGTVPKSSIPPWLYTDAAYGKKIFDSLFMYCVTKEWGLVMDKKEKKVDPRLQRLNQREWLKSMCGESNWDKMLAKYKLTSGLQLHYQGRLVDAMREHFDWAFDPAIEGHLHDNDFTYEGMNKETEIGGRVWKMVDHWIKGDLGVVLYDPETGKVDQRLLLQNRNALAASRGFGSWQAFERHHSGLYGLRMGCDIARPETRKEMVRGKSQTKLLQIGSLGHVLKWYCPKAFDPSVPGHLHVNDFSEAPWPFRDLAERKEAILHLAIEDHIPINEVSAFLTRTRLEAKGVPNLLENGESAWELFTKCFADEIARGHIVREHLYVPVESNEGTSAVHINGTHLALSEDLRTCIARQEAPEYVVIYKRTRMISGQGSSFKLVPAYVVRLNEPQKLVPFEQANLPNQSSRETVSRLLLKGTGNHRPIVIQKLPEEQQAVVVAIFSRYSDIEKVYDYLREKQGV